MAIVGKHPTGQGRSKNIAETDKYKYIDNNNNGLEHDLMLIKIDNQNTKDLTTIPLPNPQSCSSPPVQTKVDVLGWMTATVDRQTQKKSEFGGCIAT